MMRWVSAGLGSLLVAGRMPLARVALSLVLGSVVFSCSDGGDDGSSADGASCPTGLSGPLLRAIPGPLGGAMCIDETEVTMAQYAEFLADAGDGLEQPGFCSWNDSLEPYCVGGDANDCGAADCGSFPRNCVDWCDAFAYCAWAGKHLCGNVAGGGNTGSDASLSLSPANNEWMNACVAGRSVAENERSYPYGAAYSPDACNTGDEEPVAAGPVKSKPGCQAEAAYAGVFDLSGNVGEWVNACDAEAGGEDQCRVLGGDYLGNGGITFLSPGELVSCQVMSAASRSFTSSSIGFRCCG